jgi:FKBP-type peptidyl-prolyl cis-trans isomerase FkpA
MKKELLFLFCSIIFFTVSAQNDDFIKAESNIEYKIYPSANGNKIEYGNFIKMHVVQLYHAAKDTVLYDSDDYASPVQPVDSVSLPIYYYNILKQLKNNDSVVMRIIVDSAYKNSQMPMPPMFEPGKYLYTCIKVNEIFDTKAKADSAALVEQKIMAAKEAVKSAAAFETDNRILAEYFAKNNITGVAKLPLGTYIKVIKKGVGKNATTNDKVKVMYTGKSLAGKPFDSNQDANFGHTDPYEVDLSKNPVQVIAGWEEALKNMNKGTKAVIFVPSPLGYGSRGYPPAIAPNEILMFDMELVAVTPANVPVSKPVVKPTKPAAKTKPKAKKK